jgi:hypothetical protein
MKNLSTDSEVKMDSVISRLSKEQKTLLLLLKKSNVGEDALIGTFLLLKDNQELMEEMILFIWDNKPSPEEINDLLIKMMDNLNPISK